jgi:23S rRNA pseudouridine2605 synthase
LLLFSNDPAWAARVTDPATGPEKTYHVQVNRLPDDSLIAALEHGVEVDGEHLAAKRVRCLRAGERNAWLEIVLEEGRNRQIRRLLTAFDISVLRLIRVAIGPLLLGHSTEGTLAQAHRSGGEISLTVKPSWLGDAGFTQR